MASQLSPLVPHTPQRRLRQGRTPSPDSTVHGTLRDATSSTSQDPVPNYQESRYTRPQSTPTPLQRDPGKTPRSVLPQTHSEGRPSLSKKSRSDPVGTSKVGANLSSDESIQTFESPKIKAPSPCGKKFYVTKGRLKRHEQGCEDCKQINSQEITQTQQVCGTASESKRQPFSDPEERNAIKAAEEQSRGRDGTVTQGNHKAPQSELDRSRMPSIHAADISTHQGSRHQIPDDECYRNGYVPILAEEISSANSSPSADKESPKADRMARPDLTCSKTPGLEDEANPETTPLNISVRTQINSSALNSEIRAKLGKVLTPKDREGYIYIFHDPKRPELHKIGRSIIPRRRLEQLDYKCGLKLQLVKDIPVGNYTRTECLIHTFLLDLCRPYKCDMCGASHGEWFEIANEPAKAVVDLWVNFIVQESPYDPETKQLRPFIADLIKRRGYLFAVEESKLEATREYWNRSLSPTSIDRFRFKFNVVWEILWTFIWPANAMFAWTVAFVVSHHPVTFMFMAGSVIGTFISISDEYHRLRNPPMGSKKTSG